MSEPNETGGTERAPEPVQRRIGGNTRIFRPHWADSPDVERWLDREMFVGETLNFPCGESQVGDVRADTDPAVTPDVLADLDDIPFADGSFDTVYCDPPYSKHAYDKNQWAIRLWDVARKRLILQTKNQKYYFPHADRTVYLADRAGSGMAYQIFQVFDLASAQLSDFCEPGGEVQIARR